MKRQNFSRKREAIYHVIHSTHNHPTAEWVYNRLKGSIPNLSLGTVYRNIALFKEAGTIVSVAVVDGHERYDAKTYPHSHFICIHCNNVQDIDFITRDDEIDRMVAETQNIDIDFHSFIFYGKCTECKKK